jgi:hypothetical protein
MIDRGSGLRRGIVHAAKQRGSALLSRGAAHNC